MYDWIIPLITLTAMEIVLGIDNVIFLAIVVGRLPEQQQPRARQIGLILALVARLLLLFSLNWLMKTTATLFILPDWVFFFQTGEKGEAQNISIKDLVLLLGGLFLIAKSTFEIHHKVEGGEDTEESKLAGGSVSFPGVLAQIVVLDIVFSLDSVITAVGMVKQDQVWVIVVAMFLTIGVMLAFAGPVSDFVGRHPSLKILALAFLILIGVLLVAEGLGQHLNKGYIYFAMAFSFGVEMLNLRMRRKTEAVQPGEPKMPPQSSSMVREQDPTDHPPP